MLREFSADLHIHTCLSPCASLDLSPRNIIERARAEGLDFIAITDHNTAGNVPVAIRLGEKRDLKVLPGLEVQSREEVHLLTLFPDWPSAAVWAAEVHRRLPPLKNRPEILGDQPFVDEEGNILGFEERLLLNSLDLSLPEIFQRVHRQGGLTIPSHFNRGSFSLLSQLGFIPEGLPLAALEVSRADRGRGNENDSGNPGPFSRIASSDAHFLKDIGAARTVFLLKEVTWAELRLALQGREGRRVVRRVDRGPAQG